MQIENFFSTEYLNSFLIENANIIFKQTENTKFYKLLVVFAVWRFGCGQRNLKSTIRLPDWQIRENQSATVRSSSHIRPKYDKSVRFDRF